MKGLKRIDSEFVWNVVGVLAAVALLIYLADTFFGLPRGMFIPVSGGSEALAVTFSPVDLVTQPSAVEPPLQTNTPTPRTASPTAPVPTSTSPTKTPTADPSPTLAPSASMTPDPFPAVMPAYGPDALFTLHRLADGESYTYLAEMYSTTVEVLESLNYQKEGKRLWVGQYIVVIPGLTELRPDLPKFFVLLVEEPVDLTALALEYGARLDELRRYNALSSDVTTVSMRLLLVPIMDEG